MTPQFIKRPRTSALLAEMVENKQARFVRIGDLMEKFGTSAYGILLVLVALPNFIPAPIGIGGITGPITSLLGLQMFIGMRKPWLPKRLRDRQISHESLAKFTLKFQRPLHALEKISGPRFAWLAEGPGERFSGLVLIVLGVALALPIPFTNYPFGAIILLFGLAMIERDGLLALIGWLLSGLSFFLLAEVSGTLIGWVEKLFG